MLTFDDGPDPVWTPRVREVLDRHGVPGTFFVTGRQTARHPGLVRDLIRSGHEIGVHTFSHPDLATQSGDAVDRELAFTQLALAGAAGVHSSLVRMPYSSTAGALDGPSWSVARHLGEKGYVLAFVDQDTRDWSRPGARAIADAATPDPPGRGTVVLLHDSGGDRSQTVRALETLVPRLKADGYRFATVAELVGVERLTDGAGARGAVAGVGVRDRRDRVGDHGVGAGRAAAGRRGLVLGRCVLMLGLAHRHARLARRCPRAGPGPPVTGPVSVVVPACNEVLCIGKTLRSLAASDHPWRSSSWTTGPTTGPPTPPRRWGCPG